LSRRADAGESPRQPIDPKVREAVEKREISPVGSNPVLGSHSPFFPTTPD